ncbi:MAG TPA: hypothetical protein VJ201_08795 [Candidatus Babeliales bacterium]|nr:hypothetical protein [Candidatus Babeliales bacterium]
MELEIITPSSIETSTINWIEINTPTGNLILQTGHVPSIFTLIPGKEVIFEHINGEQESILIQDGLIHITRTKSTIIINR